MIKNVTVMSHNYIDYCVWVLYNTRVNKADALKMKEEMLEMRIEEQMKLFFDNPVISWHEHVWQKEPGVLDEYHCDKFVEGSKKLGFDKIVCSIPLPADPKVPPEDFICANNVAKIAMDRHPGFIEGMAFVNPGYFREASAEVRRCVEDLGMRGVKLYHHYFIDEPVLFPLVETCIDLDVPILMHAGKACNAKMHAEQPRLSGGVEFASIAKRYPEATFLQGHIGGGGDWQWHLNVLEDVPNVYLDISGSVYDSPMIEHCVKQLGAERLLFATDESLFSSVGKILGANISEQDKKTILEGTAFKKFLKEGK